MGLKFECHTWERKGLVLKEIAEILLTPYLDVDGPLDDPYSSIFKLGMAFGEEHREIFRRRVLAWTKVTGRWWDVDDPLRRVVRTKSIRPGKWCFVRYDDREMGYVDIDAQVSLDKTTDWMTVTVDGREFNRIQEFLGPEVPVCYLKSHNPEW